MEVETEKKPILPDLHLNHSHSCHGDADSSSSRCLTFLWPLPSNQGRTGEWEPQKREERGRGNPSLLQSSGGEMERSYTKKDVKKKSEQSMNKLISCTDELIRHSILELRNFTSSVTQAKLYNVELRVGYINSVKKTFCLAVSSDL